MAIGELLLENIPPAAPAPVTPVMSPQDIVAQLQGYRNAFQGMTGGPAADEALTRLGLGLLEPVQPGQTPGSVISKAGMSAQDYYVARLNQERNQLLTGMDLGLRERAARGQAESQAEATATSRQQRGITAAKAPVEVATLQTAYQKAKKDYELILAEERAGNRSPEFLQRKAVAEVALREALAKMYDAHAQLYRTTASTTPDKNRRQTMNVKTVENQDGTTSLVSTIVVNGEPYQQVFTPPRFTDIRAATEFATKEVNKETPSAWNPFAGAAPYQGTAQEEIARRAKQYMAPSLVTVDPRGRQLTPEQFEAIGDGPKTIPGAIPTPAAATPPTAPGAQPVVEQPGKGVMPSAIERPDEAKAARESLAVIRSELRTARQRGDQAAIQNLEKEEKRAVARMKGTVTEEDMSPKPSATAFERDASGKVVPKAKPAATPTAATVPAPVASPMETAGQALEKARGALARAKNTLMGYGVRQQRADPTGYRNALTTVAQLQEEVLRAQEEYTRLATPELKPATAASPGMLRSGF